ncbi:MAG TPA: DUF1778 domain-containing protein [Pseudolabrys sp.]|nr:DUF1778 domain-containing protein [Pseudolabrys sp.]
MPPRTARAKRQNRTEKIDLRLTADAKRTLQLAADAEQKTVTEFVLESALLRAEDRLPDRRHFYLNAEQWEAFQKALDAPPQEHPRLKRLLEEPSIFDRSADK